MPLRRSRPVLAGYALPRRVASFPCHGMVAVRDFAGSGMPPLRPVHQPLWWQLFWNRCEARKAYKVR